MSDSLESSLKALEIAKNELKDIINLSKEDHYTNDEESRQALGILSKECIKMEELLQQIKINIQHVTGERSKLNLEIQANTAETRFTKAKTILQTNSTSEAESSVEMSEDTPIVHPIEMLEETWLSVREGNKQLEKAIEIIKNNDPSSTSGMTNSTSLLEASRDRPTTNFSREITQQPMVATNESGTEINSRPSIRKQRIAISSHVRSMPENDANQGEPTNNSVSITQQPFTVDGVRDSTINYEPEISDQEISILHHTGDLSKQF